MLNANPWVRHGSTVLGVVAVEASGISAYNQSLQDGEERTMAVARGVGDASAVAAGVTAAAVTTSAISSAPAAGTADAISGSVVPGLGTAVGLVTGFAVGLLVTVAVREFVHWSRDEVYY